MAFPIGSPPGNKDNLVGALTDQWAEMPTSLEFPPKGVKAYEVEQKTPLPALKTKNYWKLLGLEIITLKS